MRQCGPIETSVLALITTPLLTKLLSPIVILPLRGRQPSLIADAAKPYDRSKILRLEHARDLLLHTSLANVDIAIATGFCSSSYFTATYAEHFGYTPSKERQKNPRN